MRANWDEIDFVYLQIRNIRAQRNNYTRRGFLTRRALDVSWFNEMVYRRIRWHDTRDLSPGEAKKGVTRLGVSSFLVEILQRGISLADTLNARDVCRQNTAYWCESR